MELQEEKRIISIDILKGYGIILMVMGHIGFGAVFDHYIHAFHMPIFFIISGYLHKPRQLADVVRHKAKILLLPYLLFGIFHLVIWALMEKATLSQIADSIWHLLVMNSTDLPIAKAMWFLIALFWCEVLWCVIEKIQNIYIRQSIVFVISAVGMAWHSVVDSWLPECLDISFACLLMYDIGVLFHHQVEKKKSVAKLLDMSWMVAVLTIVINAAVIMVSPEVNVKGGRYGLGIMYVLNAITAFCALWSLAKRAAETCICVRLCSFLSNIGRCSIIYLCFNQLVIMGVTALVVFPVWGTLFLLIENMLELLLTLFLLAVISRLFDSRWLRWCLGR